MVGDQKRGGRTRSVGRSGGAGEWAGLMNRVTVPALTEQSDGGGPARKLRAVGPLATKAGTYYRKQ